MNKTIVETTLGALIVALTDETLRTTRNRKKAYNLVAYLVADLFRHQSGRVRGKNSAAIKTLKDIGDVVSWQ